VRDVVTAYQRKGFRRRFKRYYHSLDLLLIDDIQFFGGQEPHPRRILLMHLKR